MSEWPFMVAAPQCSAKGSDTDDQWKEVNTRLCFWKRVDEYKRFHAAIQRGDGAATAEIKRREGPLLLSVVFIHHTVGGPRTHSPQSGLASVGDTGL